MKRIINSIKHQVHPEELLRNFSREGPSPIVEDSLKGSLQDSLKEPVNEPSKEQVNDSKKEPLRKSVDKTSHHHHHHKDDEQESCVIHTRDIACKFILFDSHSIDGVSHKLGDGVNKYMNIDRIIK